MAVSIKRIYEPASPDDGQRILIDRIWPRGVAKQQAKVDLWLKEVAPSTTLRKWFGHDPARWVEFQERYRAELRDNPAMEDLRTAVRRGRTTLLFAARDEKRCNAVVLQRLLQQTGGR